MLQGLPSILSSPPSPDPFLRQNFGIVEEDLYRSGQPNELNFPFMEKLNLKKVIWLATEEPARELYVLKASDVSAFGSLEGSMIKWPSRRLLTSPEKASMQCLSR